MSWTINEVINELKQEVKEFRQRANDCARLIGNCGYDEKLAGKRSAYNHAAEILSLLIERIDSDGEHEP